MTILEIFRQVFRFDIQPLECEGFTKDWRCRAKSYIVPNDSERLMSLIAR